MQSNQNEMVKYIVNATEYNQNYREESLHRSLELLQYLLLWSTRSTVKSMISINLSLSYTFDQKE